MPKTGTLTFELIEEMDNIEFLQPLKVDYTIDTNGMGVLVGYITYDFGMEDEVALSPEQNFLTSGYKDLTEDSDPLDILRRTIEFDIAHAFFHFEGDPNYTHRHWALKGWLNERVVIHENPVS